MDDAGLNYEERVLLGRFRPDFIVTEGTKKLIVEADGFGITFRKDALRDEKNQRGIQPNHTSPSRQ